MKTSTQTIGHERGSAIIVVLLILAVTVMLGVFATNTSQVEFQIAGSDIRQKAAFYGAEGGTDYGAQLVEERIACFAYDESEVEVAVGEIMVMNPNFWVSSQDEDGAGLQAGSLYTVTLKEAFHFPKDAQAGEPQTVVSVDGYTMYAHGAAIQQAAGYEGKGKGAAGGGVNYLYEMKSERTGAAQSKASVTLGWRHVVGMELECN